MRSLLLLLLAGCGVLGVEGNGKPKTEVRTVPAFREIDIVGPISVDISLGEPRVELSGDDNLLPLVETEVSGDRLALGPKKNVRPNLPLAARIAVAQLTGVHATGSGTITLHAVHGDRLALGVTGSATIRGDGTVHQLAVEVVGSGDVHADQIAAERASVGISGSGNVDLAVSQSLDARITGSGDVRYRGDPPEIKQNVTGSGKVLKR